MAEELASDLPVTLAPAHGRLAIECLRKDLDVLLDEIAKIIALYHESIGDPYDDPEVLQMIADIKQTLQNHFGLKSKEEYTVILNAIPDKADNQGYLQYLINALKYNLQNHPDSF